MTSMIFFRVLPLLPSLTLAIPVAAPAEDPAVVKVLSLLEENDLGSWKAAPFAFDGDVGVRDGVLTVRQGAYLCGVVWKKEPPARMNYEIELDARYTLGSDFFLGLTVPVGDTYCTWICGGWGGSVVGLSDIDYRSADENETTSDRSFEKNRWYRFKIRVLEGRIQCWIDGEGVVDVNTKGRKINLRPGEIEESVPLGISTYDTAGEYRNIVWRSLAPPAGEKAKE
jgi:hypothetical protein